MVLLLWTEHVLHYAPQIQKKTSRYRVVNYSQFIQKQRRIIDILSFPVAAARRLLGTVCRNMSRPHPLCLFSEVASRLSYSGVPSHDFYRNFCSASLRSNSVVIFGHFNRSFYSLTFTNYDDILLLYLRIKPVDWYFPQLCACRQCSAVIDDLDLKVTFTLIDKVALVLCRT